MKYRELIVEKEGPLVIVTLDGPNPLNTLSVRMLKELKEVALSFQDDPGIRVVILTGAQGVFSAGLD